MTPDGRLGLTGSFVGTVRLWELASGRCLRTLERHTHPVASLALTPDGRLALTGSIIPRTVRLWELQTAEARRFPFVYMRPRSPGEAALAEVNLREVLAEVEQLTGAGSFAAAAAQLRSLRKEPGYERDPAVLERWRQAGRRGRRTGLLTMWSRQVLEHANSVSSVALTPDGRLALTGSDGTGRLWELASGRCLGTLEGHTDDIQSVALTPDGRLALTGSEDSTRLWELASGRCLRTLGGNVSVALTPDGRLALAVSHRDWTARLWDLASGHCLRTLEGAFLSIALTPDGRLALIGRAEGTAARLWDLSSGCCLQTLEHARVVSAALTPDGRLALTGDDSGTARLWELASGRCLQTLAGHTAFVQSVALTPDGRLALTGSRDETARLWEPVSGRCLRTLEAHVRRVASVALTPDGRLALTGGGYGTARLWELDWDYEFPEPTDWDEGARPLLEALLRARVPYADPLTEDGPLRRGAPAWEEADFESLLDELEDSGYGWLRPEGVRRELEQMADAWPKETAA